MLPGITHMYCLFHGMQAFWGQPTGAFKELAGDGHDLAVGSPAGWVPVLPHPPDRPGQAP